MSDQPEKVQVTPEDWGELPEGVEVDTDDEVEEVEPPSLAEDGELADFLQEKNREFEASDDYSDEPEVDSGSEDDSEANR